MDMFIDAVNLIFIFVGLYFTILFIMLFFANEKKIFKRPKVKSYPSLSVIIPAHNEERDIKETIQNVKRMTYPKKLEIIVVDDGSTDKTSEIAKQFKDVKVLKKKRGGKASALNFGIKHASGEIVTCIDSDSYPERSALLKTVPFFEKGVAAVTTSVFVKNPKGILERFQDIEYMMVSWSRKLFEYLDAIYVTPGPMSLYKKDALQRVGGFDEKNMTEDIEIAWRLVRYKYKIKMALDAKVYTNVPKTISKWWHQRTRWNVGGIQTTLKYKNLFMKKDFGNLGTFLLPLFSISYVLSFVGIMFIGYVSYNGISYWINSFIFGFDPIRLMLYIVPDVFVVLGMIALVLAIFYIRVNFKTFRGEESNKKIRDLLVYILFYSLIFPFNLIYSSIKFLMGKYEW